MGQNRREEPREEPWDRTTEQNHRAEQQYRTTVQNHKTEPREESQDRTMGQNRGGKTVGQNWVK